MQLTAWACRRRPRPPTHRRTAVCGWKPAAPAARARLHRSRSPPRRGGPRGARRSRSDGSPRSPPRPRGRSRGKPRQSHRLPDLRRRGLFGAVLCTSDDRGGLRAGLFERVLDLGAGGVGELGGRVPRLLEQPCPAGLGFLRRMRFVSATSVRDSLRAVSRISARSFSVSARKRSSSASRSCSSVWRRRTSSSVRPSCAAEALCGHRFLNSPPAGPSAGVFRKYQCFIAPVQSLLDSYRYATVRLRRRHAPPPEPPVCGAAQSAP